MNASEITNLFLRQMDYVKNFNSLISSHHKVLYKIGASSSKEQFTYPFQVIIYWCNVDHPRCSRVLGFLDPSLAFNYRRNNGYFTVNTIQSLY